MALVCALAGCNALDADLLAPLASGPRPPNDGQHADSDAGADAMTGEPIGHPQVDAAQSDLDGSLTFDGGGDGDGDDLDAALSDASERDAAEPSDASTSDASTCAQASANDYCAALPALPAPPVIDGVLDCGPPLRALAPSAWNGAAPIPSGHAAQLALAYRDDGLYAYLEVHGQAPVAHPAADQIYCGDAVELYVDADGTIASDGAYDTPGTMQIIVAAPASEAAPDPHAERFLSGATQGPWTSSAYHVTWLADGYAVEAFVAAADLGLPTWSPATVLGFDIVIDVSGPAASPDLRCGRQLGQYFLRVSAATPSACGGEPWCDARAFCTPSVAPMVD